MPEKTRLVLVGDSAFAQVAYEYFTYDSGYEVVAFSVEREYLTKDSLFGLPVVPFETLGDSHPPADHSVYVATVYTQLNRLRTRLSAAAKAKGYVLASYISSRAFIWRNVKIGEHCFIFEGNTVQPFVTIGNNVVLWSGNHIGHHSTIDDNCFVSSHVVISGFVNVGANCFLGVNSTIVNDVTIGRDCWLGPNTLVTRPAKPGTFFRPPKSQLGTVNTLDFFKVAD